MSGVQTKGGHEHGRAGSPRAELMPSLGSGMLAQLQPLLLATIDAERSGLARRMREDSPPSDGAEDLANLNILAGEITAYERRWRARFSHPLRTWPVPAASVARDAFSLVSDDELQGQLIGQPTIEALERRHADILDTIDKRLWSLAAALGGEVRPDNPFAPRHLVQGFLDTFTPADCGPRLRAALVRRFERLAGEALGEAYAWCNRQLAEAGIALAGTSDYATLAAATVASHPASSAARIQMWGADNALEPARASWRANPADEGGAGDAGRGVALRHAMRKRRAATAAGRGDGVRHLRPEEFMAALSLLQGAAPAPVPGGGYADATRAGLLGVTASLGIDSNSAAPSPEQEDALDLVGLLFDQLAGNHQLQDAAREQLGGLVLPYLRLALEDPRLFERPAPPALELLARLVALWDANPAESDQDAQRHGLADVAARELVEEYHGDAGVFAHVLARLDAALEPLERRATISGRRAWQAIEGGERLDAARQAADRALAARVGDRPLLPAVAGFLQDQWRQSLAQAWLRSGPDSQRYAEAAALGDALVELDAAAAQASGAAVADQLVDLQPRLQACYLACGLDASAAGNLLAGLVSEFANPDMPRRNHDFTPLSKSAPGGTADGGGQASSGVEPGQVLAWIRDGEPARALRLVWRSPLTGASLLVNTQGTRELLLRPEELARMLADGSLVPRPTEGPVEAALAGLEAAAASPDAD
ncbi:DUF1631 family protein [Luteimonas dalianensis]|uniref:DUF1631 family protein n=1 Tax=Luteimonas dalianensis TaxID=1148196 RepID=UPI003BF3F19C